MTTDKKTNKKSIINDASSSEFLDARMIKENGAVSGHGSSLAACIISDIILFVSVCACISGLWSDISLFAITMTGLPVLFLRLLSRINKKVFMIVWIAVLGAAVATLIVMHVSFSDGGRLLANSLFDIGETQQGYIYDRFEVSEGAADSSRLICAGLLSVFFALGLVLAAKPLVRLFTALGLFVFTVFVCAYFGITPIYISVIGILVSPVLYFIVSSGVTFRSFLIAAAVLGSVIAATSLITRAAAPEKNFVVSEAEERLRDILAGRTVHFANMKSEKEDKKDNDEKEQEKDDDPMLDEAEAPGETGGSINGVTLLFIIMAISGILFILFVPAVFLDKVKKKREKNREGMDSEDNAVAIRSHFMYLMRWFRYKGWCRENEFFEEALPDIEKGMSSEYADAFKTMHTMWQEASFSEKEQTMEARTQMEQFVKESVGYLWDQADFKERIRIKYKYAL